MTEHARRGQMLDDQHGCSEDRKGLHEVPLRPIQTRRDAARPQILITSADHVAIAHLGLESKRRRGKMNERQHHGGEKTLKLNGEDRPPQALPNAESDMTSKRHPSGARRWKQGVQRPGGSLGPPPVCLAIFRRPEDAAFVALAPGEAAFIKCLCRGGPLTTAARCASQVEEDFDLAATFGRMLGLRLLTAGTPT